MSWRRTRRAAAVAAVVLAVAVTGSVGRAAETPLADPLPSWDEPRLILLQLTSDEPRRINGVLTNAINLQKFYGPDNVKVAIVAYGDGVRALLAETSPVKDRIASLQHYEVEFVACGNTLAATSRREDELLPGITVATAGIAEIVERQMRGWHYIVP